MKKKNILLCWAILMAPMSAFSASAPQICVGCHANDGNSVIPEYPKLNGQNKHYLVKALKDYRSGKRQNPIMNHFARWLSDKEIEDSATYYSEQ